MMLLQLLLHPLLPGSLVLLSLQLLPIVSLIKGIKIKYGPPSRLGELSGSLLRFLLGARGSAGSLLAGGSACILDVCPAQDAAVVLPPQADVSQHGVSLADIREALGGLLAPGVLVRVVDEGLLVVSRLDLRLRGTERHFEDVIIGSPAPVQQRSVF